VRDAQFFQRNTVMLQDRWQKPSGCSPTILLQHLFNYENGPDMREASGLT
jgi:hypothetical protein